MRIYNCFTQEARDLIRTGNFDLVAFEQFRTVTPSWPKSPGVYLRWYNGLKHVEVAGQAFSTGKYIGKTGFWNRRDKQHNRAMISAAQSERSTQKHYSAVKDADAHYMVPLLFTTENGLPDDFIDTAEFICVCLFQSWWPAMTRVSTMTLRAMEGNILADFAAAFHLKSITDSVFAMTG